MFERVLLMGAPGTGKTYHIVKMVQYLEEFGIKVHAIDLEDKLEPMVTGLCESMPKNLSIYTAFSWEELKTDDKSVLHQIESNAKQGEWIVVDRIDLSWPMVQRWFTQQKYNEELADRMMQKSKDMKKSSMFTPRFDQGSWQVINEQYESFMLAILYRLRCNLIMTTGIKGPEENSPIDIYGRLGVLPRGQKEIGHQPHSVFLLTQERAGRDIVWRITTGKDLPNREVFDHEDLFDFTLQYLSTYYIPTK